MPVSQNNEHWKTYHFFFFEYLALTYNKILRPEPVSFLCNYWACCCFSTSACVLVRWNKEAGSPQIPLVNPVSRSLFHHHGNMTLLWKTMKPLISVFFKVVFTSPDNVLSKHTQKNQEHLHTITLLISCMLLILLLRLQEKKFFNFA